MSILGWIKQLYYDNKIKRANRIEQSGNYIVAEQLYNSLLGKHDWAAVRLACLLTKSANTIEHQLSILTRIHSLRQYASSTNQKALTDAFEDHIQKMDAVSDICFNKQQYDSAVRLQKAISQYKKENKWNDKLHRYRAYLYLSKMQLSETIVEIKTITSDNQGQTLQNMVNSLERRNHFSEAITLLVPFVDKIAWVKNEIISCIDNKFEPNIQAKDVKDLMVLAHKVEASDLHLEMLKKKLCKVAEQSDLEKAFSIYSLFIGEKHFDSIYMERAFNLCRGGCISRVNKTELLQVIQNLSTKETYPDYLGRFVVDCQMYESEFLNAAINLIKEKSSVSLLLSYWKIKTSPLYFKELITNKFTVYREFVDFIIENHSLFLNTKDYRTAFGSSIQSLADPMYAVDVFEILLKKQCEVEAFYVATVLYIIDSLETEPAIDWLIHAISITQNNIFIDKTRELIRRLIAAGNYDTAEKYVHSLETIDEQAWTLHAEICFERAQASKLDNEKQRWYSKIISLDSTHELDCSFDSLRYKTLSELYRIAIKYQREGKTDQAYSICAQLDKYPDNWLTLYINLREYEYSSVELLSEKIKFTEETLSSIKKTIDVEICKNNSQCNLLWVRLCSLYIEKSKSQPKYKAIEQLSLIRVRVVKYCCNSVCSQQTELLSETIVKIQWSYAVELEHEGDFVLAAQQYENVVKENISSYKKRAEFRALICYLKSGDVTKVVEKRIKTILEEKSYESLKEDLAYRYTCYLLKQTRAQDAEKIIRSYIPQETELLDICNNIYIIKSERNLVDFNAKISRLIEGSMTTQDAITFLNNIDEYKRSISSQLTDMVSKFSRYKTLTRAYILKSMFNNENYVDAFKTIYEMYPNFIENDTAFRNLAVASIGIIESDCKDTKQLKMAIAIALSAIYSDRLFVNSLDNTSWDNAYTFTLEDSLGHTNESDYDELPSNVNFDSPIENQNISIRDVQNNLVIRIETAIREKHHNIEEFFEKEKNGLDALIELNLDMNFIIASPFLSANNQSISTSIREALDYNYNQYSSLEENVLQVGVMYGFKNSHYATYKAALSIVSKCNNSLNGTYTEIENAFTRSDIAKVKRFGKLYESLVATCSSAMTKAVSTDMSYKEFLNQFEIICQVLNEIKLSFTCADYINRKVVSLLMNENIKLRDGIGYMVRIYNLAPTHVQVKSNLEGIIRNLAVETEQSKSVLDRNALAKAQKDLNGEFDSVVAEARLQTALSMIVDKVNDGNMDKKTALEEIYKLYQSSVNDDRICENLVTICDMCIREYIIENTRGSMKVCNILDQLIDNRSRTLKKHSKKLFDTYKAIYDQLPPDIQYLMDDGFSFSSSLNEKGLALKKGLNYLKKLSS